MSFFVAFLGLAIALNTYATEYNISERPLFQLGHGASPKAVRFSPDGKYFAVITDVRIEIWDAQHLERIRIIKVNRIVTQELAIFSPDSQMIAVVMEANENGLSNIVGVWNVSTGQLIHRFEYKPTWATLRLNWYWLAQFLNGQAVVSSLAFNADSKVLAVGLEDFSIRLWDLEKGKLLGTLRAHSGVVTALSFSPNAPEILASAGTDNRIKLWNIHSGKVLRTIRVKGVSLLGFEVVRLGIRRLAFGKDGKHLASLHGSNSVDIWDAKSGENVKHIKFDENTAEAFFGPRLDWIALRRVISNGDNRLDIYDVEQGKVIKQLSHNHTIYIRSADFHPHRPLLGAVLNSDRVILWNVQTGETVLSLINYGASAVVTFSPDSKLLAAGSFIGGALKVFSIPRRELAMIFSYPEGVHYLTFSPDSKWLAVVSKDMIHLIDAQSRKRMHSLEGFQSRSKSYSGVTRSLVFSPDSTILAASSDYGDIKLWHTSTGELIQSFQHDNKQVTSLTFDTDSQKLISRAYDGSLKLWDIKNGRLIQPVPEVSSLTEAFRFTEKFSFTRPNKGLIESDILLQDITGKIIHTFSHSEDIQNAVFSPDGRVVACVSHQGESIYLWDIATGQLQSTLQHPEEVGHYPVFRLDSKLLASRTDGGIFVWRVEDGSLIKFIELESAPYTKSLGLAFSQDGKMLAASTEQGILVWGIK